MYIICSGGILIRLAIGLGCFKRCFKWFSWDDPVGQRSPVEVDRRGLSHRGGESEATFFFGTQSDSWEVWNIVFLLFPDIGFRIIPIDFHTFPISWLSHNWLIFFRGVLETTRRAGFSLLTQSYGKFITWPIPTWGGALLLLVYATERDHDRSLSLRDVDRFWTSLFWTHMDMFEIVLWVRLNIEVPFLAAPQEFQTDIFCFSRSSCLIPQSWIISIIHHWQLCKLESNQKSILTTTLRKKAILTTKLAGKSSKHPSQMFTLYA